MDIKKDIKYALVSTGRISSKDRIEITEKFSENNYVRAHLYAYHGREKQPFVYWNICVDVNKEIILWETSTFYFI